MVPSRQVHRVEVRSAHLLSISVLVGVLAVALGAVTVVSVYLHRVGSSVENVAKADPLPGYSGRPTKAAINGAAAPVDYLVMVTDEDHILLSVHLVHLSGSRDELTLIGVPADLLVTGRNDAQTLAALYADGSDGVAQQIELLLGVRTDHQVRIGLAGFSGVVEALGGLDGIAPATDGRALLGYVAAGQDGPTRVDRVSELVKATMSRLDMVNAVTNPYRFDRVLGALEACILVDSDLTVNEFEGVLIESKVRAEEIGTLALRTTVATGGREADADHLAELRAAIAWDDLGSLGRPITAPEQTSKVPRRAR